MGKIMKAYRGFSVAAKLWWCHNCVCLLYPSLNFINSFFFEAQVNLPFFTFLSTNLYLIAQEFFSNTESWPRYYETTMLMFKWTAWKLEVLNLFGLKSNYNVFTSRTFINSSMVWNDFSQLTDSWNKGNSSLNWRTRFKYVLWTHMLY